MQLGIKVGLLADQVGVRVSGMHPDSILTGRLNIDDVIIAVNGELMLRSPVSPSSHALLTFRVLQSSGDREKPAVDDNANSNRR
jgi:hypothetical protein